MKDWLVFFNNGLGLAVQIFIIVFATLFAHFIQVRLFKKLKSKLEKTPSPWDDIFVDALDKPLGVLIWLMGLSIAIHIVKIDATTPELFSWIHSSKNIGVIVLISWFLIRFITRAFKSIGLAPKYKSVDIHTADAIAKILKAAVIITTVLIVMQTIGIPISGLLAFGGAGTVIVGFASKDLLANFFGALTIYLDRPFKVGDWIASPDRSLEGTVEHIGWRLTRIRTFDQRPLYVPNSVFTTILIENPSRMLNRRIKAVVGIRYDDTKKLPKIVNDITQMLKKHPEIDPNKTTFVNLINFGPSSLDLLVYTFTKTTQWVAFQQIQQDVFMEILKVIEENAAEVAFPTQTVHIPDAVIVQDLMPKN